MVHNVWIEMSENKTLPPQVTQQIMDLLAKNNKIEAVKVFRQATGLGLREALDAVNGVEAAMKNGGGTVVAGSEVSSYSPNPVSSGNTLDEVAQLMKTGQKIQAIKVLREHSGTGLKEAKDAVEALALGRSEQVASLLAGKATVATIPVKAIPTKAIQPNLPTVTEVGGTKLPPWIWIALLVAVGIAAYFLLAR